MMIKSKLAVLMASASGGPFKQIQVANATKIRPATISDIYHGKMKRLDMDVLEKLCAFFGAQPGDLLEYIPDEAASKKLKSA